MKMNIKMKLFEKSKENFKIKIEAFFKKKN